MRHVKDGNGQLRHMAGYKRDRAMPPGHDKMMVAAPEQVAAQPPLADLPIMDSIAVYDQESEGSCGANMGCTKVKFVRARLGAPLWEPSRQNLYKSTRNGIEGTPLDEDSGVEIRDIFSALAQYGVCAENLDVYIDMPESYGAPITPEQAADALLHQALFYYRCADIHAIKASILQGFPVGFGFTCFESLMSTEVARTGLVPYPEAGEKSVGGHANTIFGYDDNIVIGAYKGAFESRNSWGKGWGLSGNLYLPYQYIIDSLASDFWTLRSEEIPT